MPFRLPTFNNICDAWTWPAARDVPTIPVGVPRLISQACALVYGRRVNVASTGGTTAQGVPLQTMNLLLPPGTYIRGPQDSVGTDLVEVPSGSGRWYICYFVDDIGKLYANEHRTASLLAVNGMWVAPYL